MRFHFIQQHAGRYSIQRMCRVLQVARSGYYAWCQRQHQPSQRAQREKQLLTRIQIAFAEGRKTYGYRRVHALVRKEMPCSKHLIARIMRKYGIQPKRKRRFRVTTQSQHHLPIAPNLLVQNFAATQMNQKWVADITYLKVGQGWLYLATLEDLFSRLIVGWALEPYLNDVLTRKALTMALGRRTIPTGLIHHSDRGRQYASTAYRKALKKAEIEQSMSRRGNSYDNAPMESFYSRLKNEWTHHRHYHTRAEAHRDIFEYIEVFYNRQRLHSALGYRSPADFEALYG